MDYELFQYQLNKWRSKTFHALAAYVDENGKTRIICYYPCDCQQKYSFKKNSKLLPYLQQCKGWIVDPQEKYTLNYVMIVLLAYLREKNLIYYCEENKLHLIHPVDEICKALEWSVKLKHISEIRMHIARAHLEGFKGSLYHYTPYFTCPRGAEKVVIDILGEPGPRDMYFGYHGSFGKLK